MKYRIVICLAVVLSGSLFGCASKPKVHFTTPMTSYDGQTFDAPRMLQNGSGSLSEVYAWANFVLGTNSPLETVHADIFQDGSDDLFITQPAWSGTGGNLYLAFKQNRRGYRFVGDIWFGGLRIVSSDGQGRPRLITSSWGGGCRCHTALCILERDGFHEVVGRNLPCGDCAYGQDQLHKLLFESTNVTEEDLELIFNNPATTNILDSVKLGNGKLFKSKK